MKFTRRLLLYGFGFAIGCVLVYFTLYKGKNRTQWLPENRVKDLLAKSELVYSAHARCMMDCRKVTEADVKDIITNGDVNFKESITHDTPCPTYALDGTLAGDKKIRIIVTTVDSVAEVETAIDLNSLKDTCKCK